MYPNASSVISEEMFENFTTYLLGAVLHSNTMCHVILSWSSAEMFQQAVHHQLLGDGEMIDLWKLQLLLENLTLIGRLFVKDTL